MHRQKSEGRQRWMLPTLLATNRKGLQSVHPNIASPDSPADLYTLTLPYVTAETLKRNGQGFLWAGDLPAELVADPQLVELDVHQGVLPGFGGVLNVRTWVRGKRKRIPWDQLDLKLAGLDKHRGRTWTEWDDATMAQVRRQTWNVSDLSQRRIAPPSWMNIDAIVSPVTGDLVRFCRNPRARRMLEILWAAYEEGAGGVMMSREHWATVLHCSPRSVYNYQQELFGLGLAREVPTWRRRVGGKPGSGREHLLLRIGPTSEGLAGIEPLARRCSKRSGVNPDHALLLAVALRKRMRLRGKHVSGALYQQQLDWRRTSEERARGRQQPPPERRRSAKDIASVASAFHRDPNDALLKRQTVPNSPPLVTAGDPAGLCGKHSLRSRCLSRSGAAPEGAVADPGRASAAALAGLALERGTKRLDTDTAFAAILRDTAKSGGQESFAAQFLAGLGGD